MKREFSPEAERFYARVKADQDAKATEQANKPTATTTVTARYLAIGGAHVSIAKTADAEAYDDDAVAYAETTARKHAETCRRVPERLWPEGGTR